MHFKRSIYGFIQQSFNIYIYLLIFGVAIEQNDTQEFLSNPTQSCSKELGSIRS
jgi:hypothetical protein